MRLFTLISLAACESADVPEREPSTPAAEDDPLAIEAIKELSESFGAEAAPMVVTVEGETRRLTGTAAAQYESWRRLLKQIYEAETGFVDNAADGDADPVRIAEPTG